MHTPISSSWASPRSSSKSTGPPCNNHCGSITRTGECGSIAITNPLTGYEPNLFDIPEDFEGLDTIFRGANLTQLSNCDMDSNKPVTTEVGDEDLRNAVASPLLTQESGERADVTQTYHSNEDGLLRSVPSILVSTEQPVPLSASQKSSQELGDERFMTALQIQREQIMAEANFEIQKHESKASVTEDYIRVLKGHIESRDLDLRRSLQGYAEARRAQDRLQQEVSDSEQAPREDRLR